MAALHSVTLGPRLALVSDLYDACDLAADIGTDHAHLPAALLQRGLCQRMILTDISPDALNNARGEISRRCLTDRVDFRLGSGLLPLHEACSTISITGMGGRTIRSILLEGQSRLRGAALILSAHTDLPLIRQTVMEIGYHLDREEPCFDNGRYYLVFRAFPGPGYLSAQEIRLGGPLFRSLSPVLPAYLERRRNILSGQLSGLLSSRQPDPSLVSALQSDIHFLECRITHLRSREVSS